MKPTLPAMKSLTSLLAAFLFAAFNLPSAGAAVLNESFDSETFPADWTIRRRGGSSQPGAEMAPLGDRYALLLERYSDSNGSAAVFYTGTMEGIEEGVAGDFSGSVVLTLDDTAARRGLALRAQSMSYAYSGYFLSVSNSRLQLSMNPASHTDHGTLLKETSFATLSAGVPYRLEFSMYGSLVNAALYQGSTLIGTLEHDLGAEYEASGYFGMRSAYGSNGKTYFSDFTLAPAPIPEPASLALLAFGLLALGLWRKR